MRGMVRVGIPPNKLLHLIGPGVAPTVASCRLTP
jgi:hypothetical protein